MKYTKVLLFGRHLIPQFPGSHCNDDPILGPRYKQAWFFLKGFACQAWIQKY